MKFAEIKHTATNLKVLGHSKRLEIVCLLQGHSLTVNQVAQMTALRQSSVSQHLMILKDNQLVCPKKIGKEIYYTLCHKPIGTLARFISDLSKNYPLQDAEPTVIDPICAMALTPSSALYTTQYGGVTHYFCGKGCLKEFHAHH